MIQLTADEKCLLKDLALFLEPVEISDAKGKLVGVFVPANLERAKQLSERLTAATNWVELERRTKTEKTGRTTREVFERLLSMTQDPTLRADLEAKIAILKERDGCVAP
jgi:hypothetical protein